MICGQLLQVATFLAGFSHAVPSLFESEKIQLAQADIDKLPPTEAALFQFESKSPSPPAFEKGECKVYPGDEAWPADSAWASLNELVEGRLLKPRPKASVCYQGEENYNSALCSTIARNWTNSYSHLNDPIEMFSPLYEGLTCLPPSMYKSQSCTQGGYPLYVINATTPKHVQAGANFARNTGIRLVVKNTGHDFSGKSGGGGALSIWTHHLKEIQYIENYLDDRLGYSGPAFKTGTGVQSFEIYKAASEKGRVVVGGEGETVGVMGGYIQGGGHSPLSSLYGTGADQVLAFEVVTADGQFVTADSKQNSDLFWAFRGGGGSTFGIATSVTVKAHPDMQVTTSRFSIDSSRVGNSTFWAGIRAYFEHFAEFADAGTYAYLILMSNSFSKSSTLSVSPFFAPNKTIAETQTLLNQWLAQLKTLGLSISPQLQHYDSFYAAWRASFPLEGIGTVNSQFGSRLWPRRNFATPEMLNRTLEQIRLSAEKGLMQILFQMKNVDPANADNAVSSHWRENLLHDMQMSGWAASATVAEIKEARRQFTFGDMQRWRDASPGAGSYLGESDRMEPDFGNAFWGTKYPRLLELKAKLDPHDVFYAATTVGSERWNVETADGLPHENGKLCKIG